MTTARIHLPAVFAALLAVAGCGTEVEVGTSHLHVRGTDVEIQPRGHAQAIVKADGQLIIDGAAVAVPETVKPNLIAYNRAVRAIEQHGLETGRAGADVAASAASEVAKGLTSGDTSQIGAKVEAKAEAVKAAAHEICADLDAARREQEAVVAVVDAFRPYAVIEAGEVERCRR